MESIGSKVEFPDNQKRSPGNKAQPSLSKESKTDLEIDIKKERPNTSTRDFE
jgi:hypothetical protein